MAKRFTDTGKWAKASFADLNPTWKLVWIYFCDNCDHAGIWDINWRLLEFHLGVKVDREMTARTLGDKVVFISDTKMFIPSFIEFQYGELNPENRAHLSVLNRLKKEGAYKGLVRSSQGRKDKDKDKDKDKEGECEGKQKDLAQIYSRYPLKKGKSPGLKKLKADLAAGATIDEISTALDRFIEYHKQEGTEPQFIPQFKTWASTWRDCLDPDYGESDSFSKTKLSLYDMDLDKGGAA